MQDMGYILLIIVAVIIAVIMTRSKAVPHRIQFNLDQNQVRNISSIDAQMETKYGDDNL